MRGKFLFVTVVFLFIQGALFLGPVSSARGQTLPQTTEAASGPHLQAELLKTLDAARVRAGDEVKARTITPFEFDGTEFPAGAALQGHVAEAQPNRLLLVFDRLEAKKKMPVPLALSLRAVMMPHAASATAPDTSSEVSPSAGADGGNRGVDQASQNPNGRGDMLRSPVAAAADSSDTGSKGPGASGPGRVATRNGEVIGLPGVHLQESSDPKAGAAFESDPGHKLRLEKGLQLLFVVTRPK